MSDHHLYKTNRKAWIIVALLLLLRNPTRNLYFMTSSVKSKFSAWNYV
jgi:hypothetical protein